MVIRVHDGPKKHEAPYVYAANLVPITMFPRMTGMAQQQPVTSAVA